MSEDPWLHTYASTGVAASAHGFSFRGVVLVLLALLAAGVVVARRPARSAGTGKPRGLSLTQRFFVWAGGAQVDLAQRAPSDLTTLTSRGAAVLGVAIIDGVAFAYAAHTVLGAASTA